MFKFFVVTAELRSSPFPLDRTSSRTLVFALSTSDLLWLPFLGTSLSTASLTRIQHRQKRSLAIRELPFGAPSEPSSQFPQLIFPVSSTLLSLRSPLFFHNLSASCDLACVVAFFL